MNYILGFGVVLGFLTFAWLFNNPPVMAQQAPYAMYPLTLTDVNGKTYPLLADCLIVTPQGYAVILERSCPR